MKEKFTVEIVARGEGLVYRDNEHVCHFEIGRQKGRLILHAYRWSDEESSIHEITLEIRTLIIPRILECLHRKGYKVDVLLERPPQPLRSVDDIIAERLNRCH
jgi:hypothetical protein